MTVSTLHAHGVLTYTSKTPCATCENRERFTHNYKCTNGCSKSDYRPTGTKEERAANASLLVAARAAGKPVYPRLTPCIRCAEEEGVFDSVLRYSSNGGCVACQKRAAMKRNEEAKAQFKGATALIIPCASTCSCGERARTLLPELNGETLVYAEYDHPWPTYVSDTPGQVVVNPASQLVSYRKHLGKCIFCYPDKAIGIMGILEHNLQKFGELDPESEKLLRLLRRANSVVPGVYPKGFLQWSMVQYIMRKAGPVAPPEMNTNQVMSVASADHATLTAQAQAWLSKIALPLPPQDD